MGNDDSAEKHSRKHEKHRDKDPEKKHKKRRKHDDHDDADRHRKHKHRKRDKESKVNIIDDGDEEKLWVEKDIDMDGERVCKKIGFSIISSFILEPDSSNGYSNGGES